jgi:putative membrane protein
MKRSLILGLFCAGSLCVTPLAFAQGPGGGSPQSQSPTTPSTVPGQGSANPGAAGPGANGPMDQGPSAGAPSKVDDKKFVKEAALGGLTEVELGKVAAEKASSPEVKQFAQKMVDDHTKANEQLKQIASKSNIPIADTLDSKHQSRIDKLSKLSGPDFDKAYVKDQVKDHEKDVRDFQAEAQGGTDPNVKSFAASTLPVLQEHLDMVKNLNKSTKSSGKTSGGQ